MKLKVDQNYRGQFNLLSKDETHSFHMSIVDNEGNIVTSEEGVKAHIQYNGEESHYQFDSPFEYLEDVFDFCFKYSQRIISGTDYVKQHLFFLETYNNNFAEISSNLLAQQKEKAAKEIVELEKKIKSLKYIVETEDDSYLPEKIESNAIYEHNKLYEKWIQDEENKLKDVVPGSETAEKINQQIEKYKSKIYA